MGNLFKIFAVFGIAATIITIIQFISPNLREQLLKYISRIRRVRFKPKWDFKKIDYLIEKAQNITILQTWIPSLNRDIASWEKTSENCNFKILLISENLIKKRIKCRGHKTDYLKKNIERLMAFDKRNIELRLYDAIPFGPVYIIDDDIFWGIYLSNRCSMDGPMFFTKKNTELGELIYKSVASLWEIGEEVNI